VKSLAISIVALVVSIFCLSLIVADMDPGVYEVCYLEVKYVVFNSTDNSKYVEVVGKVWLNGNVDFNNRPFRFRCGSKVVISCPEYLDVLGYRARFSFWQKEENPTFQGLTVTNRTLTIVLNEKKAVWWANYVLES